MSSIQRSIKLMCDEKKLLTGDLAGAAINEIMEGKATGAQIGAFLTALSLDKITPDVVAGAADVSKSEENEFN
jgi:anthranilate phosphoribosyltransferase